LSPGTRFQQRGRLWVDLGGSIAITRTAGTGRKRGVQAGPGEPPAGLNWDIRRYVSGGSKLWPNLWTSKTRRMQA